MWPHLQYHGVMPKHPGVDHPYIGWDLGFVKRYMALGLDPVEGQTIVECSGAR